MKPTYYPKKMRVNDYEIEASHLWNLTERCLEGSIPIEKTPKNSHFRYGSSKSHWLKDRHYVFGQRRMQVSKDVSDNHERSSIQVLGSNYYGAKASINVWNPKVENQNEFSLSHISFNSEDGKSSLAAGWMVNPSLYGGNKTRFFIYWVTDVDESPGCFNLDCPGFVQTNHNTLLSGYLQPVSVYGGPQYSIDVEIFQDMGNGNWWLRLQGVEMGYWPKEVVPSLAEGAGVIVWGGEVVNMQSDDRHTSTQMGSGHYSNEGFEKASFFKNVQVLDASVSTGFSDPVHLSVVIQSPKCYDLQVGGKKDGPWGYFFFYGGPGRSNICT
uniref:ATP synthase subunit delta n=1 Tax=Anthurium amnicola TaxID=1678845 RepID=A0A1D1ZKF8_9ARAE